MPGTIQVLQKKKYEFNYDLILNNNKKKTQLYQARLVSMHNCTEEKGDQTTIP
jgi:hypothetical protein